MNLIKINVILQNTECPDTSVSSWSSRTDRQRTAFFTKLRTASGLLTESRQTKAGQIPNRKHGQNSDSKKTPDKNETRTGHGQCCSPTSGSYWQTFEALEKFSKDHFWDFEAWSHQQLKIVAKTFRRQHSSPTSQCSHWMSISVWDTWQYKDKNFFPEL